MGNNESEPRYEVTQHNYNDKFRITYHNHPNSQELLRIFRLFSKDPFPFIHSIEVLNEQTTCCDRSILKVTTPQHPFNLQTLLNLKRKTKGFLVEKQIWYLIKSIINILAFMQINGIVFGVFNPNFFHLQKGRFLTTQILHLLPGNQHENNYSLHNYYSPEKLKLMSNEDFYEKPINIYKSQVFSFALLILQVASTPLSKPKFQKPSLKQLVWTQIRARFEIIQQRYSQKLCEFLDMVLREDVRIRPDWTYLRIWMTRNEPFIDVAPCIFWSI